MVQDPLEHRELVITRRLKAPRELVWRTFEDPYLLAQWWGPENFTSTISKLEFRAGGEWHVTMRAPDGAERPVRYQFVEIVAPERIVYRPFRPPEARGASVPTYLATLTFEALGNETVFTMRAEFEIAEGLAFARTGGFATGTNQAFDKLERLLASRWFPEET
jgi:uncharacterized protein YndB with AHSA1/START domain